MEHNKTFWVAAVGIIVIGALGFWWASAGLPLGSTWTGFGFLKAEPQATTTPNEETSNTGASGRTVTTSNSDVASIVQSLSGASTFKSLFASTGVGATINPRSESKYTIFVPTDGAVSQLARGTISNMTAAEKKRLVEYHIVSGRQVDADALASGQVDSLSGDPLNFNYAANRIPMVNSAIIVAEYKGTNGVVYVIDNVLIPPTETN